MDEQTRLLSERGMVLVGNEDEEVTCEEQDRANANGYFDHELKPDEDQVNNTYAPIIHFDTYPVFGPLKTINTWLRFVLKFVNQSKRRKAASSMIGLTDWRTSACWKRNSVFEAPKACWPHNAFS